MQQRLCTLGTLMTCLWLLPAASQSAQPVAPLRQQVEVLQSGQMRVDKVKEGLFVVRGPFVPCATRGCRPNGPDDGLIHEPGDVAIRVTPEGLILIDDKYPENILEVLSHVRGVSSLPVRYLLNTHHHADHVSGNANLRALGVDIIGHRNIRENFLRIKQPGEPNIVFADESAVYLGGVEVKLIHFGNGHTNGDTVVYFPDLKTVHMGDLVIDGMPVIDYAGGGSAIEFIKTIDKLLELDFDTAIPGHGHVMTKADVQAYRARFQEMNNRMRTLVKKRFPRDQILTLDQARIQLKLSDLGWENSVSTTAFMTSIGLYYDEMAAAP
jgi:glyoxylase-like metal-dependent hydrolase (beta-lactamase superfamily II)